MSDVAMTGSGGEVAMTGSGPAVGGGSTAAVSGPGSSTAVEGPGLFELLARIGERRASAASSSRGSVLE